MPTTDTLTALVRCWLAAGTRVRIEAVEEADPLIGGNETTFLASTDGGRLWYRYKTYGDLPTK